MINKYLLVLMLCFVQIITPLGLRSTHELAGENHQFFYVGEVFQTFQLLGIIVIIIVVGVCCFYFRGAFSSQDGNATNVVVVQGSNRDDRIANPAPAPRENRQYISQRQPVQSKNPILEYYSSQNQPIVPKNPPQIIKDSNNPYVTVHSTLLKWDPVKQTVLTSCAICNLFNKSNSVPIVQVQCIDDHCFHLLCISQHRSKQVVEKAGNGLNKCPKCKESYSPIVKIFCPSCKNMAISISLVKFSNEEGQINSEQIIDKYGVSCQNCRNH